MGAVTVLSYVVFGQAPWPELLGFGVLGALCAQRPPKGPESGAPNRTRASSDLSCVSRVERSADLAVCVVFPRRRGDGECVQGAGEGERRCVLGR